VESYTKFICHNRPGRYSKIWTILRVKSVASFT
jgi:hypothetical protein